MLKYCRYHGLTPILDVLFFADVLFFGFLIPFVVMVVCYGKTISVLIGSVKESAKLKGKEPGYEQHLLSES